MDDRMSLSSNAARMIARKGQAITLTRTTYAASDAATPWIPGAATIDTYSFKARVTGVSAEYVDGTTIVASDRMAICSTKATHSTTDGAPADGAVVDLDPQMGDVLQIDGADKVIKKVAPSTDRNGAIAVFRLFVAS
jgi:hypothetical protein